MKSVRHRSQPQAMSGLIGRLMTSLGLSRQYDGWMVVTRWREIVGDDIARNAHAIKFEDGDLYIAIENAAWRQELSMKYDAILEQIHCYPYGKAVKQLRLVRQEKGI